MAEWKTDWVRAGLGSLNLNAIDTIPESDWTRLINVRRTIDGAWIGREGQTSLTNAIGTKHHSIARLSDPTGGTYTRIWGIDTSLYYGQSGALTLAETGFSGDPLTLVPASPPHSDDTWMYVADRTKMRKIRIDGLDLPIGLTPPAAAPTVALGTELTVTIENFESGFTGYAGSGAAPTLSYPAGKDNNCLNILTAPGAATAGYYNIADKALSVDLSTFGGGVSSTKDDLIHLYIKVDRPDYLSNVRVYFVVSSFTGGVVPGISTTQNTDAYFKSFLPSSFTTLVELTQGPESAAEDVTRLDQIDDTLYRPEDRRAILDARLQQQASNTLAGQAGVAGRGQWSEYGVLGYPLRKSEFTRIGSGTGDWNTVTGILVVVQTATNQAINVSLDQAFLRGGRGPDTTDIGQSPYDYRVVHYDTRTGVLSNPSPVMAEANFVNSLRREITITPAAAYGDAAVRQWAYRRGGDPANTTDWHFVAANTSDGGVISDTLGDDEILAEDIVETDNDQPVTTVNNAGDAVYNQPIPVLFGPVDGYLFGLGDPYRPGFLYWSKLDTPDSWPSLNRFETCASAEQLMTGLVFGTQPFCWSRDRLFAVYLDQNGPGRHVTLPTPCTRGVASRWSACVGPDGLYAADRRGVYRTTGGIADEITEPWIRTLFRGVGANGLNPINFALPDSIRVFPVGPEIWLVYQDTANAWQTLIFDTVTKAWRVYDFAVDVACLAAEPFDTIADGRGYTVLMGGVSTGRSYTHNGTSDNGTAISGQLRTAALTAGFPRNDKLLGDLVIDLMRNGVTITATPYLDYEASSLAGVAVASTGRQQTVVNPFSTVPTQAKNLSVDLSWSSSSARPVIYAVGWSYILLPEGSTTRPTDWEDLGTAAAKLVKGVALLVDTGGATKTLEVEGILDNGSIVSLTTASVTASGRRLVTLSWVGQRVTQVRLRPTDTNSWQIFDRSWLADLDALGRTRFEGQPIDYGRSGWKTPLWAEVAIRSTSQVTLTVTAYGPDNQTSVDAYAIPATAGVKRVRHVKFNARKGVLFTHVFTCTDPFWVYPQESYVEVQPWQGDPFEVHALGLPDIREGEAFAYQGASA